MSMLVQQRRAQAGPRESAGLVKVQTPFQRFVSDFFESRVAIVAFIVLLGIIFIAVAAPLISPTDPYDLATVDTLNDLENRRAR